MKIEISKRQFKFLLELVYIGNWVANSDNPPDAIDEKYEEITKIIYSYGKEAGLEKYVAYSKHSQAWSETNYLGFESNAAKLLKEYDERIFWNRLAEEFAIRDFYREYGKEEIKKMSSDKYMEKVYEFIDKYTEETNDHGIDRFEIIKQIPKEI